MCQSLMVCYASPLPLLSLDIQIVVPSAVIPNILLSLRGSLAVAYISSELVWVQARH